MDEGEFMENGGCAADGLRRGACVLLRRADGFVLAVSRPNGTAFSLPGGRREEGEGAAQNASRELLEETGVFVPPEGLRFIRQGVCEAEGSGPEHWVEAFDAGFHQAGANARQVEEGTRVEWMSVADLLKAAAFPVHLSMVLRAANAFPKEGCGGQGNAGDVGKGASSGD